MNKHFYSLFTNEQELLKAVLKLHIKKPTFDVDPMFFKGNFYKDIPRPKYISDLNPKEIWILKRNATNLDHIKDQEVDSIILDPPFMFGIHGKANNFYSSKTHGIFPKFNDLEQCYKGILKEAYRILNKKGICVFKCQDYTDAKTTFVHCLVWQWAQEAGFYVKDLVLLNLPNKVYNSKTNQRHFRKTHTYFFILEKRK